MSSIYHHVPFAQDASVLMIGERTNANGSKAFREAMLAADWQSCVEMARRRRATARTCSTCASTTSAGTAWST